MGLFISVGVADKLFHGDFLVVQIENGGIFADVFNAIIQLDILGIR